MDQSKLIVQSHQMFTSGIENNGEKEKNSENVREREKNNWKAKKPIDYMRC